MDLHHPVDAETFSNRFIEDHKLKRLDLTNKAEDNAKLSLSSVFSVYQRPPRQSNTCLGDYLQKAKIIDLFNVTLRRNGVCLSVRGTNKDTKLKQWFTLYNDYPTPDDFSGLDMKGVDVSEYSRKTWDDYRKFVADRKNNKNKDNLRKNNVLRGFLVVFVGFPNAKNKNIILQRLSLSEIAKTLVE